MQKRIARMRGVLSRRSRKPASYDGIEGFAFVVGYGRSGSTVIQNFMNALPGVHIAGENFGSAMHLAQAWATARTVRDRFANPKAKADDPWFGADNVDPDSYGAALAQNIFGNFICPPAGTRFAGYKEIRWLTHPFAIEDQLDFHAHYFQPAKFILNIREPEDVVRSGWWADRPRDETIALLNSWNAKLERLSEERPSDCLLIRYDKFRSDQSELMRIADFLGIEAEKDLADRILGQRLTHSGVPRDRAGQVAAANPGSD